MRLWNRSKQPPPFKSLAEKAKTFGFTTEQFKAHLKSLGFSEKEIEASFSPEQWRGSGRATLEHILKNVEVKFGAQFAAQLSQKISLEIINGEVISCSTSDDLLPDGRYPIRVFAGFIFFVNKLAHVFTAEMFRQVEAPSPRAIEEARALLDSLYAGTGIQEAWTTEIFDLGSAQETISYLYTMSVRTAAIAHEVAHVIYFLASKHGPLQTALEETIARHKRPLLSGLDDQRKARWTAEFGADLTAVKLLNMPLDPLGATYFPEPHALIVLLHVIDLIERRTGYTEGPMTTHPPAVTRVEFLTGVHPTIGGHRMVEVCSEVCQKILPSQPAPTSHV
jgi:hypothetical protein